MKISDRALKVECIHCKLKTGIKNGKDSNGNQRFKCEKAGCGKSFTLKSIEHPQIRRDKRIVAHLLLLGYPVSDISKITKIKPLEIDSWQRRYLPKLDDLIQPGKLIKVHNACDYISALDKGRRPDRVNKNNTRSKFPAPKKSTRKDN